MVATPGNAIDLTGSAGIVLFDGTSSVTTTAPSNHNVLVGTGAASITSVTPSTSGFVLLSNGASSDPSFQTVPVSSIFAPNSIVQIYDDFVGTNAANAGGSGADGQYTWNINGAWNQTAALADNGHPGVLGSTSIASGHLDLFLGLESGSGIIKPIALGGGALTLNWVFKIATLSTVTNTYTLRLGLGDTSNADEVNGVYFEYTNATNSGKWVIKTAKASTRSTTNSSVTVTTGYHNAQIAINAAGTSVTFTMDGTSLGTIATNIPTAVVTAFMDIVRSAGTIAANSILVDLFYMTQTLTTAR